MLKSPFKFLDSYTREDPEIFFGREQEINELLTMNSALKGLKKLTQDGVLCN